MADSTVNQDQTRRERRRAVVASTVGTTIEWYDFFLYLTASALIFPTEFFPKQAAYTGILLSFGTQFVGFAARSCSRSCSTTSSTGRRPP